MELVESGVFADFIAQNEATLTRKGDDKPQPVAMGKAAKVAKPKKTKPSKVSDGPSDAELAAIEADRRALGFDID
jgi:hypothetical protein